MIDGIPTYCINLDRRPDRMAHFALRARAFGFEYTRFEAVDGSAYSEHPDKWAGSKTLNRGQRGCYESHRMLLSGLDSTALILEDDAAFADGVLDLIPRYMKQLPPDWDMFYLGGFAREPLERYSANLLVAKNVFTTHAYLIRDKFIPTALKHINSRIWKVDVLLAEAQQEGKCFLADPVLAWQRAGHSDIEGRVTDNKHLHPA